jgi:hypothetical protein
MRARPADFQLDIFKRRQGQVEASPSSAMLGIHRHCPWLLRGQCHGRPRSAFQACDRGQFVATAGRRIELPQPPYRCGEMIAVMRSGCFVAIRNPAGAEVLGLFRRLRKLKIRRHIREVHGWETWIRTRINGVRVAAASSCLPRLKPGTVLNANTRASGSPSLSFTGYLWRETAYASLLQFSPPILEHISAIKTKLGTEP